MIVPGGVALDHSNEEILDIKDALEKEVERLKASTAEPLPIAAEKWQGQQTRPWQNIGTYNDGPAIICQLPIECESYDFTFTATAYSKYAHPVPAVSNRGRLTEYHPHQKLQQSFLSECYLLHETWFADPACLYTMSDNLNLDSWGSDESHYFNNILDPRLLAARSASSKYNEDNPSFDTVMRGPFQAQFLESNA
jgi:hypothetical protein